jgi:hypothetical protein
MDKQCMRYVLFGCEAWQVTQNNYHNRDNRYLHHHSQ